MRFYVCMQPYNLLSFDTLLTMYDEAKNRVQNRKPNRNTNKKGGQIYMVIILGALV